MQVIFADGTEHDFAGVNPHPNLEIDPLLTPELFRIPLALLLHAQGSVQRTLWVIFVGNRGAEEREDAVA
jgi:hypothetical protein